MTRFLALSALALLLCACATTPVALAPDALSRPLRNISASIDHLQHGLGVINILCIVALGVGLAAAVYGLITADRLVERIGIVAVVVAGGIGIVTLMGIVVLPFAPEITGIIVVCVLGAGGYVAYEYFKKPAAVTTVATAARN